MCYAAYALDCLCTYQSDKQAPSRRHQCCAMQRGRRVNFRWLVSVIHKLVGHNTITRIFDCRSHIQTCFRVQVQNPSLLASGTSLQGKCSHTHTHTQYRAPAHLRARNAHLQSLLPSVQHLLPVQGRGSTQTSTVHAYPPWTYLSPTPCTGRSLRQTGIAYAVTRFVACSRRIGSRSKDASL